MKRTYQPKKCQRSKVHCFRKRMAKSNGSKVLTRLLRLTAALLVLLAQAAGVLVTDEVGGQNQGQDDEEVSLARAYILDVTVFLFLE